MSRIFTLILALSVSSMSIAESTSSLSVEIRVPNPKIRLGDPIAMTVIVENNDARQSVALRGEPGFSESGGFELLAIDETSTARQLPAQSGRLTVAQVRSGSQRVVLPPGNGMIIPLQAASSRLFPRAGRYQLVVNYRSLRPDDGNRSTAPNVLEGSQASSRAIEVIVE